MSIDIINVLLEIFIVNLLSFLKALLVEYRFLLTRKANWKLLVVQAVIFEVVVILRLDVLSSVQGLVSLPEELFLWLLVLGRSSR